MFVHEDDLGRVHDEFVAGARALKVGDPLDPTTDVGPMVDANAAARTQRWVDEAVALGGTVLAGGNADGTFFPPTILTDVPITPRSARTRRSRRSSSPSRSATSTMRSPGQRLDVRAPDRRLHQRPGRRVARFDELEVGGVIVNDVPTYRIDHMPYGGVKDSGLGREGLRWAIEDMTEIRIMVLAQPG